MSCKRDLHQCDLVVYQMRHKWQVHHVHWRDGRTNRLQALANQGAAAGSNKRTAKGLRWRVSTVTCTARTSPAPGTTSLVSWVIGFSIWIDYFLISRGIEFPLVALVGIVGGVYWMKRQWIWILGKVTRMDDTGEYYLFSLFNYFRWIAPLLGVLSLFLVFFNQEKWMNWGGIRLEEMIFWAIPFFWAISFVFRLFRVLFRFTSKGVGVFLRFLFYFCVLEIIPTLVLIKWFWRWVNRIRFVAY